MKMFRIILLSIGLLLVIYGGQSAFAANVCFTCHEESQFKDTVVHQPVTDSQCSVCHNPHVARYKGLLRDREDSLCYSCHKESKALFSKDIVHSPVAKGKCSACHAPHASSEKGLVNKDLATNCLKCHTTLKKEYKQTHKPYADGNCTSCHNPHQADNLQLLKNKPDALCLSCHNNKDTLQSAHKDYPAALKGCLSCHNPHGSDRKALMRNFLHEPYVKGCTSCHKGESHVSMETCLSCHPKIKAELLAPLSHITRQKGNSCLNCHSPHAGDDKALLKNQEKQVCTSCHMETLERYKKTSSQHSPVKKCSSCHQPHGSKNLAMLKGGSNAVCIQCHESQGNFTHPVGPKILETHTGQMVTCVSCHNPMGTNNKFHLIQEGKKALCVLCHRTY